MGLGDTSRTSFEQILTLLEIGAAIRDRGHRLLARILELRDLFVFVDPFERPDSPSKSLAGLRGLGGRLLGFNIDPDFADVLDVQVMVDLRQTDPRTLARYMGIAGAATFLARHRRTS